MNMRFRLNVPLKRPSPEAINLLRCGAVLPPLLSQSGDGRTSVGRPDLTLLSLNIMTFKSLVPTLGNIVCDLANQQKCAVWLWFDVGRTLLNNLIRLSCSRLFSSTPWAQSSKMRLGNRPNSRILKVNC